MSDQPGGVQTPFPSMLRPEFALGAALPLWGYVAGAVATGTAWWWMTRWTQGAPLLPAAPAKPTGVQLALVADNTALVPVGGESAPVTPAVLEGEVLEAEFEAAPVAPPTKPPARRRSKDAEA